MVYIDCYSDLSAIVDPVWGFITYHKWLLYSFLKMTVILNRWQLWVLYQWQKNPEIFLMPYKPFVDIHWFNGKKLFNVDVAEDFSKSNRCHLEISCHCYLKTKNQRWKLTLHYWVLIEIKAYYHVACFKKNKGFL